MRNRRRGPYFDYGFERRSHLAAALKKERIKAGLTQARLAAMVGLQRSQIAQMETDKRPIFVSVWRGLVDALPALAKIEVGHRWATWATEQYVMSVQ